MAHDNRQVEKTALITGGARRIGAAIVKKLHASGFRVAIHCLNSLPEAEMLAMELNKIRPESASVFQGDLSEADYPEKLIHEVMAWASRLDVLVNNASVFYRSDCREMALQDWQEAFVVNVQAPFALSLAAAPILAGNQGAIINITDIHAERPLKGYAVYSQTKAALLMQTRALAREMAPNVRVNAVAPGSIVWPEEENELSYTVQQAIIAKTPLRCHGDPTHIAEAVLALISNRFVTGQVLNVDGGRSIIS